MATKKPTNYGATNAFGDYTGYVINQGNKYYQSTGSSLFGGNKGDKLKVTSPFSDFERNWYIENGFGDPTRLQAQYYDRSGKLIQDPTKYAYQTPMIKGQGGYTQYVDLTQRQNPLGYGYMAAMGTSTKYNFAGVSPEARQLYLLATGGTDPVNTDALGNTVGPKTTVAEGKAGIGTIQSIVSNREVPILEDPNQGRNEIRIRRY